MFFTPHPEKGYIHITRRLRTCIFIDSAQYILHTSILEGDKTYIIRKNKLLPFNLYSSKISGSYVPLKDLRKWKMENGKVSSALGA